MIAPSRRLRDLWKDDGGIVAMEYLFVATLVGIGLVVGLTSLTTALNTELTELSNAVLALNQSYCTQAAQGASGSHGGTCADDTPGGVPYTEPGDEGGTEVPPTPLSSFAGNFFGNAAKPHQQGTAGFTLTPDPTPGYTTGYTISPIPGNPPVPPYTSFGYVLDGPNDFHLAFTVNTQGANANFTGNVSGGIVSGPGVSPFQFTLNGGGGQYWGTGTGWFGATQPANPPIAFTFNGSGNNYTFTYTLP